MNARMRKRIVFGAVMIAVLVGLLLLDAAAERWMRRPGVGFDGTGPRGVVVASLALLLVLGGVAEMRRLLGAALRPLAFTAYAGTAALAVLPFAWQFIYPGPPSGLAVLLAATLLTAMAFFEQMLHRRTEGAIGRLGGTLLTLLYLGLGAALILHMRLSYGLAVMVLFLLAVKGTDIGAYFAGSRFGKHKIIPWLSPGKSWEGLAGGLATAAAMAALGAAAMGIGALMWWEALIFGLICGLFGQFADLCESLLKRSADIKDSAGLVPEFGGVLDIVDSPLLATPFAHLALALLAT